MRIIIKKHSHIITLLTLFPLFVSPPARGEAGNLADFSMRQLLETEITLEEVFDVFNGLVASRKVSLATGKRQETSRAPAVTSVITAQDIEAMGARSLNEALTAVPGLHISNTTVVGIPQPIYVIRGMYSGLNPEVLMLINGEPFKMLDSGDRGKAWRDMPAQAIRRIEVMRSPGSALYGADAFAGVINVITKTAEDIQGTEVGGRVGGFDTRESWLLHGGEYADWDIAMTLELRETDGLDTTIPRDAQSYADEVTGSSASLAPGPLNMGERTGYAHFDAQKQNWRLHLGWMGQRDAETGLGINYALDPRGYIERDRLSADLVYHDPIFTPLWDVTFQLNYVHDDLQNPLQVVMPPGTITPRGIYPEGILNRLRFSEHKWHLGASAFYAGYDKHLLRLGAGTRYEDLYRMEYVSNVGMSPNGPLPPGAPLTDLSDTPFSVLPENIRQNWYFFIQDSWRVHSDWELTLGLRYDDYSDFGDTFNPRLGLVWQARSDLTAKLLYGRAFRAPSFTELYWHNSPLGAGNPDLEAETIQTWELALDWRPASDWHFSLTPFYFRAEDKILPVTHSTDDDFPVFQNTGAHKGHGLEFETRWKVGSRASLLFNYAYAETELNGTDPGYYPPHQVFLRHDWLVLSDWYLDTRINWIAAQARPDSPKGELGAYTRLDMTLRYKQARTGHWNLAFGVRNLLDKDIRQPTAPRAPVDLPTPGRNWFLEARYQF